MSQRKTLSKVPLTPQFTTNGPKSNRNKIRVLSGLTVWIISCRLVDIGDTRYDNVTLIPLVLQLGLRIGPIQRMGAN